MVDVNENNKVLQTEMLFSDFFSVPLMTRWHIHWYYYVQKAPEQYLANR